MTSLNRPLRCLLTAGPTREHLDPVRFLSNGSSGKMGYALALAAARRGWQVDLVSGPVALPAPAGVAVHRIVSAADMLTACEPVFGTCDLFIAVAAVADYRPRECATQKRKKLPGPKSLELVPTVDILRTLAARRRHDQIMVGFAAETNDVETHARQKLTDKRLDWIVANDVARPGIGMESDENAILLLGAAGARLPFGPASKSDVAEFILATVVPESARH